ncbi:30S ribosomal protein S1, chloroplastic [Apostasia shenzhenica]|uniref:rRNA biogenesis protein RRP5 n=1 Tax=Apostasia shenzhenica TaxID=1088818 RepID=A0A2H9ZQL2_9ASPA|nr:30S ribosomal protein S1, chloroplastic [Apostasia shenzhenica]
MVSHNGRKFQKRKKQNAEFEPLKPCNKLKKAQTKNEAKSNGIQRGLQSSVFFQDDEIVFPRGGRGILSRTEEADAQAEAEAEFGREQGFVNKGKERQKKIKGSETTYRSDGDEWGSLFGGGILGNLPKLANRVTLKNIAPGMKIWGVIVEINAKDLVISLPGGPRGFVRAEDACDVAIDDQNEVPDLHKRFNVGQLVSCIVLQLDNDKREAKGSKRIWLSLRLSILYKGLTLDAVQDGMVMVAQVRSVEDHGCILHFGVSSFTGFLPKMDEGGAEICVGQLLQCTVKKVDKGRGVVYADSNTNLLSKYVTKDIKGLSIDILVPGMMVNARVHSKLENGIMLSFLTYFTGTVDIFHLQTTFPSASWKQDYTEHQKVNARILFIDPSTRAIGMTLNPHLLHYKSPPVHVKIGEIYDNSRVFRIDGNFGILLDIPSSPENTPTYVHRSDVADEEVLKLEKKFKLGDHARLRILEIRCLEGLAIGTLKASVIEGSIFTHSDVKPGMLVKAKVIAVEPFGAIVQIASGVKALCPLRHMSELDIIKPAKKFKVGVELTFRVLGCKSKRITVTHKKTLVKSKLEILASYADATVNLITHGWITKIERHGCYVRFYNGVQGFAPRSELGLELGSEPSTVYHIEQVVKCRITSSVPASRKINVSFVISSKRARINEVGMVRLGSVVAGIVDKLTPTAVIINFKDSSQFKGSISYEHLADNQGQVALLRPLLRPGFEFDQLVVLDIEGSNIILSAKYSLIYHVEDIPSDITHLCPLSTVHGYVSNIIETGCFVRFLGCLTGFSSKIRATDHMVSSLFDAFYIGQSVRSHIVNVDNEAGRIKLSLKQSFCFSTDISYIQGYFLLDDKISMLQSLDGKVSNSNWVKDFNIGIVVMGEVQDIKEFGIVLGFSNYENVVGFVAQHQLGELSVEKGSVIRAVVLDISKSESLVDLSLKPNLINSKNVEQSSTAKKKRHRGSIFELELHQTLTAIVEIVKENYLVVSLPEYNYAVGYASIIDYNTEMLPRKHFFNGQSVLVTIEALHSADSSGRLLLRLKSLGEALNSSSLKRAKKLSNYTIGALVDAEIIGIKQLELCVKFGVGLTGKIHVNEVDDDEHSVENRLSKFRIGQLVNARIIAKVPRAGKHKNTFRWLLSSKPSILSGNVHVIEYSLPFDKISIGSIVTGYVVKVDPEWVKLTISKYVKANLFILDSSSEPSELREFNKRYYIGQVVTGRVISMNKNRRVLRLSLHSSTHKTPHDAVYIDKDNADGLVSNMMGAEHIMDGDIIGGKIKKILPNIGGVLVQIGPHLFGRVHYTELVDSWVIDPLSRYQEGLFVKCKVLEISRSSSGFVHADLSLRASMTNSVDLLNEKDMPCKCVDKIDDLLAMMEVYGYVKNVTSKGCFIMLSRKIDARILLSNLSDGFVENPDAEFPVGKLVHGRVLCVDISSKKVDVTLKKDGDGQLVKPDSCDFSKLHVGDLVSGHIRRVEVYGLFISIDGSNLVGLCHVSEVSDDHVDHIETKYRAGEKVVAKILKIDQERQRIRLGMKKSYIEEVNNTISNEDVGARDCRLPTLAQNDHSGIERTTDQEDDGTAIVLSQAESRAFFPPLQVSLDDSENFDLHNATAISKEIGSGAQEIKHNKDRKAMKVAKQEREREIRASEEKYLRNGGPETVDDFEKLVRSSPNSSFSWIKYMEFMLAQADVQKARSIAERALKTINIQEEGERLNIWVAYFNIENAYGTSPEEDVDRAFKRALQTCDPKKLHLALLGMYQRTEQYKLAEALLNKMTKKFRKSCKVWLSCMQNALSLGKEDIQSVINRALLSLPIKKHIKFISHTAILEFKCGVPDRGRSMFEGILREHPKRTDIWNIYLDQVMYFASYRFYLCFLFSELVLLCRKFAWEITS